MGIYSVDCPSDYLINTVAYGKIRRKVLQVQTQPRTNDF
jgi:hypothetical protein